MSDNDQRPGAANKPPSQKIRVRNLGPVITDNRSARKRWWDRKVQRFKDGLDTAWHLTTKVALLATVLALPVAVAWATGLVGDLALLWTASVAIGAILLTGWLILIRLGLESV